MIDSIASNTFVTILKDTEIPLKLGERSANWYLISYTSQEQKKQGYLWGGNLSIGYRHKNGEDFLFGLGKSDKKIDAEGASQNINIGSIKRMLNQTTLDEVYFETGIGESLSSASFTIDDSRGLKNVDFMISALVTGEACGIPSYQNSFLFTSNQKIIPLPQLVNIGDADVFYDSEAFIFPDEDGGIPNTIFLEKERMERDDEDREIKNGEKISFSWDGTTLSEGKQISTFKERPTP